VEPAPPRSGGVFLVRSGHFFFRYRDAILPGVLLTLLVFTRPKRPFDSYALDTVLDGLGLLLACAGQALRIGTIGYTHIVRGGKGRRVYAEGLVTSGLFATSRNPLYLGNLLIDAGLLVVWNNQWVYVVRRPHGRDHGAGGVDGHDHLSVGTDSLAEAVAALARLDVSWHGGDGVGILTAGTRFTAWGATADAFHT
jgi:hypothetical protein